MHEPVESPATTSSLTQAIAVTVILLTLGTLRTWAGERLFVANEDVPYAVRILDVLPGALLSTLDHPAWTSNGAGRYIAFGPGGHLWVSDKVTDALYEFNSDLIPVRSLAIPGVNDPGSIAFGPDGYLYLVGFASRNLTKLDPTNGSIAWQISLASLEPNYVRVGHGGELFLGGYSGRRIEEHSSVDGNLICTFTSSSPGAYAGIAFRDSSRFFAANNGNPGTPQIEEYDASQCTGQVGSPIREVPTPARDAGLTMGPDGLLYAVRQDPSGRVIRMNPATLAVVGEVEQGGLPLSGNQDLVFAPCFFDNFDDGDYNDWTVIAGTWMVDGGALREDAAPLSLAQAIQIPSRISHGTWEWDTQVTGDGHYAQRDVHFIETNAGHYYALHMGEPWTTDPTFNNWILYSDTNPEIARWEPGVTGLDLGIYRHVEVSRDTGGTFVVRVDGVERIRATDTAISTSDTFTLMAQDNVGGGQHKWFDNVRICAVSSIPDGLASCSGEWSETSRLPEPLHAGSVLACGSAVTIGGSRSSEPPSRRVYSAPIMSPGQLGSWQAQVDALPRELTQQAVAISGSFAFSISGACGSACGGQNTDETFVAPISCPLIGPWRATQSYPIPLRQQASAVAPTGRIYVVGGSTPNALFHSEIYSALPDPNGEIISWRQENSLPLPLAAAMAVAQDNHLYIMGGVTTNPGGPVVFRSEMYRFDMDPNGILGLPALVSNLPSRLGGVWSATVAREHVFLLGLNSVNGSNEITFEGKALAARLRPDGSVGPWISLPPLPISRSTGALTDGSNLYAIGGRDGTVESNASVSDRVFGTSLDCLCEESLNVSGGASSILAFCPSRQAGLYDIIRGDVRNLSFSGGRVELGAVTCLANDSRQTDTEAAPDPDLPGPGRAFFYLFRDCSGSNCSTQYGSSSDGRPRLASSGDCIH